MGENETKTKPAATGRTNAPKKATKPPLTFDHLKSKKKPQTRRVPVPLDSEVATAHAAAKEAYEQMRQTAEADLNRQRHPEDRQKEQARQDEIEQAYLEALEALEACTVQMVFQSPGRKKYEKAIEEHPPTPEQVAEVKATFGEEHTAPYNPSTFAPALISLCCIEPEMTSDQVLELMDDWNPQESTALFAVALEVCTASYIGSLGNG